MQSRMKTQFRTTLWLCSCGLCLLALGISGPLFLGSPHSISEEKPVVVALPAPTIVESTSSTAEVVSAPPEEVDIPRLAAVVYPPGSVGAACEVNEFPPRTGYWFLDTETQRSITKKNPLTALDNEECNAALERHLYAINPYLWGTQDEKQPNASRVFSFVVIDNPLTFERIFADPEGDFARVQEAFAYPDCQLGPDDESNWSLNETCHAESILNYALLTRFCYDDGYNNGIRNRSRQMYWEEDNPTPEQDRSMWIQDLEADWVRKKCKAVYPQDELQAELRKQIWALQEGNQRLEEILINLAAKLGDSAAGLTQPFSPSRGTIYGEEGYKYGPHTGWFTDFFDPNDLFTKHPPSVDRLHDLVLLFAQNIASSHGVFIKFDHEALVRHLCTPPYYDNPRDNFLVGEPPEPPSCRDVVNELRQESLRPEWLEVIATFEDVAMRLGVYE